MFGSVILGPPTLGSLKILVKNVIPVGLSRLTCLILLPVESPLKLQKGPNGQED